jgi:hypothetical protein
MDRGLEDAVMRSCGPPSPQWLFPCAFGLNEPGSIHRTWLSATPSPGQNFTALPLRL